MEKRRQSLSLSEFQQRFPDDQACMDSLASIKWSEGFICEKYGYTKGTMMETYAGRRAIPTDSSSLAGNRGSSKILPSIGSARGAIVWLFPESVYWWSRCGQGQSHRNANGKLTARVDASSYHSYDDTEEGLLSVPNSNDLLSAKKRNSLKGVPFGKESIWVTMWPCNPSCDIGCGHTNGL